MELYGLIVFYSQFILNLPKIKKRQKSLGVLNKISKRAEVRRASQFHCDSMHALIQNYERSMTIIRDAVVS